VLIDSLSALHLDFDANSLNVVAPDDAEWVDDLTGRIVHTDVHDNFREHIVGTFAVTVIYVAGARAAGVSLPIFWEETQALTDLSFALYRNDLYQLKPKVLRAVGGGPSLRHGNCVTFDRMMIYPQYRGKGVGLRVLRTLMAYFWRREIAVFALIPFPLQCANDEALTAEEQAEYRSFGLHDLPRDRAKGVDRLRAHWAQAGFTQLSGTDYMVASATAPADVNAWWTGRPLNKVAAGKGVELGRVSSQTLGLCAN